MVNVGKYTSPMILPVWVSETTLQGGPRAGRYKWDEIIPISGLINWKLGF